MFLKSLREYFCSRQRQSYASKYTPKAKTTEPEKKRNNLRPEPAPSTSKQGWKHSSWWNTFYILLPYLLQIRYFLTYGRSKMIFEQVNSHKCRLTLKSNLPIPISSSIIFPLIIEVYISGCWKVAWKTKACQKLGNVQETVRKSRDGSSNCFCFLIARNRSLYSMAAWLTVCY